MPKGPQGQKRPADVVSNAVRVMRILTGEEDESPTTEAPKAAARGGESGRRVARHGLLSVGHRWIYASETVWRRSVSA